jgi:hypothetical protein
VLPDYETSLAEEATPKVSAMQGREDCKQTRL